jgi:hypothetical protein
MERSIAEQLSLDTVVVVVPSQVSAALQDETVILELSSGIYYGLNPTGAFIWNNLQQPITLRVLSEALVEHYDVGEEQAMRSLFELLHELLTHRLIEIRDESAT